MLFQIDVAGGAPVEIYPEFWREHEVEDEVRSFAEQLVEGVVSERERLDALIAGAASNWRVDRMAVVDRNILRMASYELAHLLDTPVAVILDEAIEVGKRFGTEQSGAFINGVLDAVRRELARVRP
jgi:N utilization substance protein B